MSDNRTAEQILKDHGLGNSTVYSVTTPNGYSYSTIDAMEEYASQQTSSLQQELMKYQTALQRIMDMSLGEDKKRDIIVRMDIHLIAAEALSGKESKS